MKHEPMEKYMTKIFQQSYYVLLLLANNHYEGIIDYYNFYVRTCFCWLIGTKPFEYFDTRGNRVDFQHIFLLKGREDQSKSTGSRSSHGDPSSQPPAPHKLK